MNQAVQLIKINKFSYDDYGNIKTVSDSRGATLSYKYDGVEHMFVREITVKILLHKIYYKKILD